MPRSPRLSRFRTRLFVALFAGASATAGAIAGCGIDDVGSLVFDVDASENVGASLPETGAADGSVIGDGGRDASGDNDVPVGSKCTSTACVANGGACEGPSETCVFRCDGGASCTAGLTCPPGVPCRVICDRDDACKGKIDCTQASSCDIACSGKHTCEGVACAGKQCAVRCTGTDSCQVGTIDCTASDSCLIACTGDGMKNCRDAVTCKSASCSVVCDKDSCPSGVTATAGDASILCGANACADGGATCYAPYCQLACKSGPCSTQLCCDGGTCLIDGGPNNCP